MRVKMNLIAALTIKQKAEVFERLLALKEDDAVQAVVLAVACDVAAEARAAAAKAVKEKAPVPEEVDVFDFHSFPKEQEAFAVHYSGLELMLRLAIFLSYKYNHLAPENRDLVRVEKSKKTGKTLLVTGTKGKVIKKDWFDEMTDAFVYVYFRPSVGKGTHTSPRRRRILKK